MILERYWSEKSKSHLTLSICVTFNINRHKQFAPEPLEYPNGILRKGIEESVNITDIIENIDIGLNKGNIMPKINIENGYDNHEEYLRYLVFKTFDEKFGHMSKEDQEIRRQRLETELPVLYAVDYTDYFIMLYMLVNSSLYNFLLLLSLPLFQQTLRVIL